ncbi:uncharacterized protein LOC115874886 [Sitophilus oryzae]|uniref:Uncharacterized protein LOC115874886 n=1 Tax=Sitophilus oryzae TaxID=7048 RepID=A0A6J2X4F8_SITOR|nr:uncharacterized protein LOC115874886 [Sitophilus oryzae]
MIKNERKTIQTLQCLDIFVRINGIRSKNFKFVKTQFYQKITSSTVSKITPVSQLPWKGLQNHRYEKVSTPKSGEYIPKFNQKGLVVVWPQPKKFPYTSELYVLTWLFAHTLYFLYVTTILPVGTVISMKRPPWNCRKKLKKLASKRDYFIEPDWDS